MEDVLALWADIQNEKITHEHVDVGISQDVYLTDEYVFKSGADSIWTDMQFTREARKNGLPTPRVVNWSRDEDVVVYERIQSDTLSELSTNEQLGVAHTVGKQLSRLHEPDYSSFGSIDDFEDMTAEFETYPALIDDKIQQAEYLSGDSVFDSATTECIRVIQETTTPEHQTASILHEDYHTGNILVSDGDVFVIDFENAELGAAKSDFVHSFLILGYSLGTTFAHRFADGYGVDIADLNPVYICMGALREIEGGRWWERTRDADMTDRKTHVEAFLDTAY